jgi:hypothetical protein
MRGFFSVFGSLGGIIVAVMLVSWTVAAACSEDSDEDCCIPPTPRPPTNEELAWIGAVCAVLEAPLAEERSFPGYGADTTTMTLEELIEWAGPVWAHREGIHSALIDRLDAIDVPSPHATDIHSAIVDKSRTLAEAFHAAEADMDTDFSSLELAREKVRALEAIEEEADAAIEDALRADPGVLQLEDQYEECAAIEF